MDVVVTTGAIRRANIELNKLSLLTNQHPVFNGPDALPVAQPTVSKHWREKSCNFMTHKTAFEFACINGFSTCLVCSQFGMCAMHVVTLISHISLSRCFVYCWDSGIRCSWIVNCWCVLTELGKSDCATCSFYRNQQTSKGRIKTVL